MSTVTVSSCVEHETPGEQESILNDSPADRCEQALVEGSFREALRLSNAILSQQTSLPSRDHSSCSCLSLQGAHIFSNGSAKPSLRCWLDWKRTPDSDPTDRAAAVALQSWFELSQKQPSSRKTQFLRPFEQCYFVNQVPLSLELLVVLVRFFRGVAEYSLAVQLSSQALRYARREARFSASNEILGELFTLLWSDLLPNSLEAARVEVERFRDDLLNREYCYRGWTSAPQKKALIFLLEHMNPTSLDCVEPEWVLKSLHSCHTSWASRLEAMQHQDTTTDKTGLSSLTSMVNDNDRLLPVQRIRNVLQEWVKRLLSLFQTVRREQRFGGENAPDRKRLAIAAASLVSLWLIAHRFHILRRTSTLLRNQTAMLLQNLIWKPAREIVDALLPGS